MRHWRGIVAAFSCSTTSASSQITNRRDRRFPIFTLGPRLVGGAPPPNTPRLAALAFLHPSAQATVAAKCRTFSHAFRQNSYGTNDPRVNHFSQNSLSRSGTIAGWGRSAPQHPPGSLRSGSFAGHTPISADRTNTGSQTESKLTHFNKFRCSAKFLNPPMQNSKIYNS
jgi:hypothetical protein